MIIAYCDKGLKCFDEIVEKIGKVRFINPNYFDGKKYACEGVVVVKGLANYDAICELYKDNEIVRFGVDEQAVADVKADTVDVSLALEEPQRKRGRRAVMNGAE